MGTNVNQSPGTLVGPSPGALILHGVPAVPQAFTDASCVVSVFEFGVPGTNPVTMVTGNGTTDDSAAINAAIVAMTGSGKILYFPAGTYLVTANAIVNPGVQLQFGPGAVVTGTQANALLSGGSAPFTARAVMTTVATSTTYSGSGTGTLTFGSNAAMGTQDGVATLAAGDVVILPGGTLGSCAITAKDVGPYVITQLGSGALPVILTRPTWWANGSTIARGAQIKVGIEGTLFGGTVWSTWCAASQLIGTNDPVLFPDEVSTQVTLASSQNVLATVPIRSATATAILCSLAAVGGTTTSTVGYGPIAAATAGYIGTCTVTIVAQAAGMSKNGSADASIVSVLVKNRAAG